jgi:hypothetical protein
MTTSLGLNRTAHIFAVSAMFLCQRSAASRAGGGRHHELADLPPGLFAIVPTVAMLPVGAWLSGLLSQGPSTAWCSRF